jgi:hypothetical protein
VPSYPLTMLTNSSLRRDGKSLLSWLEFSAVPIVMHNDLCECADIL